MATEHEQARKDEKLNQLTWHNNPIAEPCPDCPSSIWLPFPHTEEDVKKAWELVNGRKSE